eukprot:3642746-Rhodomonas_salina.1
MGRIRSTPTRRMRVVMKAKETWAAEERSNKSAKTDVISSCPARGARLSAETNVLRCCRVVLLLLLLCLFGWVAVLFCFVLAVCGGGGAPRGASTPTSSAAAALLLWRTAQSYQREDEWDGKRR